MSQLDDLIEQYSGVQLHRKRVLTAFGHVQQGPLLDMLFKLTRPPLRKLQLDATPQAKPHRTRIVRRGMVDYRRDLQSP
jgi:hypothetical protein